jgi:hypothetical protein
MASCNDDFMQQIPQTAITVEGFFNSTSDLQTYVNNFYNDGTLNSGGWFGDLQSDDVTVNTNSDDVMFKGLLNDQLLPENAGGWDGWGSLRSVNVMLTNLDRVAGSEADINHLVGIARYFRAWFYIDKVEAYSDVPWIDKPLSTTDEQLYLAQTPRAEVVQHIFEDLNYAAEWIKPAMGDRTQIHKYCALALISRFALYEGTFRKYHPELALASTADALLQKSIEASEAIIGSGLFEITGKGVTDLSAESLPGVAGSTGFRSLFTSMELKDNKEVILWRRYGENKGGANMSDLLMTTSGSDKYSLSRSLQESFLTKDGNPYSTVAGYDRKTFSEVFADRDPRFAETFAYPGISTIVSGGKTSHVPNPQRGGYSLGKYYLRDYNRDTYAGASLGQYNGLPIYRYAEILLNYAEAKAELGGLTAEIVDQTVNELRDRVGMPHFDANREVDATLRSLYQNVTDNALLALRRERRVELAGEGLRLKDVSRWYAGKVMELEISKQGIYVPSPPFVYTVPGATNVGFGIAANQSAKTSDNVKWYYLATEPFYLSGTGSGFIRNVDDQSRKFDEPRDYYRPIPRQQTVLNPKLKQPYGWEE